MTETQNAANARTELKEIFAECESEYRDSYKVLHESANIIVLADPTGHELNELSKVTDTDREELRQFMRERAEDTIGESQAHEWFSYSDPLVFDK